jgi:hypothetical protein
MSEVKAWLGGEGSNELGTRADRGDQPGVIEALLRRVEPTGWHVEGATRWKDIRKFRVGAALRDGENHQDIHNVCGLALKALDNQCALLAFTRDTDADDRREDAITRGIAAARQLYPNVRIVGGCAVPAIEGWILALSGVSKINDMSRKRTLEELSTRAIDPKSTAAYVAIVESADLARLPNGCDSLTTWLGSARVELTIAVRGAPRPTL